MEIIKGKSAYFFSIKSNTWYKDSHSLYDYQSTKLHTAAFSFPLNTNAVTIYRKRAGTQVIAVQSDEQAKIPIQEFQILTRFQIQHHPNFKLKLHVSNEKIKVKPIASDRLNTNQSIDSVQEKQQQAYIIIKKIKDLNGEPKGFKLQPGNTIKLGRVQYFVSQVRIDGVTKTANLKSNEKTYASRSLMVYNPNDKKQVQKNACKICLQDLEDKQNFLFNPCLCSGSCGTVHLQCLMQWIHFKVKKQVVGGTLHYNFQKFSCEVCKQQLPMIIDIEGVQKQLLPIQKPESNYLILEGACQKTKSVMLIQNVPSQGIKLGRGHQCQIRITDISVSRNHAVIKNINNSFYLFDNKSKFGTLVRPQKLVMDLSRISQGLQIGRTTISLDLKKEKQQVK